MKNPLVQKLIDRRHALGMSQAQLVAIVGGTQSAISDIETRHGNPTLAKLDRIATALHCSLVLVPNENNPALFPDEAGHGLFYVDLAAEDSYALLVPQGRAKIPRDERRVVMTELDYVLRQMTKEVPA